MQKRHCIFNLFLGVQSNECNAPFLCIVPFDADVSLTDIVETIGLQKFPNFLGRHELGAQVLQEDPVCHDLKRREPRIEYVIVLNVG